MTQNDLPRIIRDTLDLNPFQLAGMAECSSPDSATSPGALMLSSVLTNVLEAMAYVDVDDLCSDMSEAMSEAVTEAADSGPDVYTYTRWTEFLDLAAWQVDLSDYGDGVTPSDLTEAAGLALYCICQNLGHALVAEAAEALETAIGHARDTAEDAGYLHGTEAARWWAQENIGGRVTGDVYPVARAVLDGIENGDPEIMDSLPSADLSGQWADGVTVADLLGHDLEGLSAACEAASAIGDAYVEAFDSAAQDEVQRLCLEVIEAEDGR